MQTPKKEYTQETLVGFLIVNGLMKFILHITAVQSLIVLNYKKTESDIEINSERSEKEKSQTL